MIFLLVIAVIFGGIALTVIRLAPDYESNNGLIWIALLLLPCAAVLSLYRTANPPTITCRWFCLNGPVFHPSQLSANALPYLSDAGLLVATVCLWLLRPPSVLSFGTAAGRVGNAMSDRVAVESVPSLSETSAEVKVCPDCAEEVKGAARVCRFCGYQFPQQSA